MQASAYLFFSGQCEAAFTFYEQCLGGKLVAMITHGETPMVTEYPDVPKNSIVHARLQVGDTLLMGSDCPPEYYEKPQGLTVSLLADTPAEAERIFGALADGGKVQMPLEETFWAVRFGMVKDRFGTPWMVNCEKAA